MNRAYDTILETEVLATNPSFSGLSERYRYVCAHCGEEVILAAIDSTNMVPHFRHKSGNNDKACDEYLGSCGLTNPQTRFKRDPFERAAFYFDNDTKLFYIGLRFDDAELALYQESGSTIELRTEANVKAIFSEKINRTSFISGRTNFFHITHFANNYILSNTYDNKRRKYEFFRSIDGTIPAFYVSQGSGTSSRNKLIRNNMIYTGTQYVVITHSNKDVLDVLECNDSITVSNTFKFRTIGKEFIGKEVTFLSNTIGASQIVSAWGYQLSTPETLTILWPPAILLDNIYMIDRNYAYLYSSFELYGRVNTNLDDGLIMRCGDNISQLKVQSIIKIYRKNVEVGICTHKWDNYTYDELIQNTSQRKTFVVPDEFDCFHLSCFGVVKLKAMQFVVLTSIDVVRQYTHSYQIGQIFGPTIPKIEDEILLQDIIAHYKREVDVSLDFLNSNNFSQVVLGYLENSRKTLKINYMVKKYIEEGRL